jgi:deoxycytidine triphosphate deaminase
MRLLKDDELVPLVRGANPILTGHSYDDGGNVAAWFLRQSPVQPCSVDLTVGDIFLPGTTLDEDGSADHPMTTHNLDRGQTAIITTRETLHLRPNLAAFGFPPSHVSFQGLLMTNPGHVDPGYAGRMRFTVINMGSKQYRLARGEQIVTLLLFELSGDCQRDWLARGNADSPIRQANLELLSKDFLDVEERAKKITDAAVNESKLWATGISAIVPLLVGVATLATTLFVPGWRYDLEKQMAGMKEWANVGKTEARVTALETELSAIKAATCKQSPLPPYCPPPARGSEPAGTNKGR